MKLKRLAVLMAITVIGTPIIANADSITYDFTGTVTAAGGNYASVAVGTTVTGTYTFDLANGSTTGTVGSTNTNWSVAALGGLGTGLPNAPLPTSFVFSSTLTAPGLSYSTQPIAGAVGEVSYVGGNPSNNPGLAGVYLVEERRYSSYSLPNGTTESFTGSDLTLSEPTGVSSSIGAPYTSTGLPAFLSAISSGAAFGDIQQFSTSNDVITNNSYINYNITAVNPVPLPAAAWLMLSGCGGLAALTRKKRAA